MHYGCPQISDDGSMAVPIHQHKHSTTTYDMTLYWAPLDRLEGLSEDSGIGQGDQGETRIAKIGAISSRQPP